MIEATNSTLYDLLNEGITKAKEQHIDLLVSMTEKINIKDPITFFRAAYFLSLSRVFWSSTTENLCIVGAGSARDIITEDNRFVRAQAIWNQIIEKAVIHNPYKVSGTGVLALGGMRFDPEKSSSKIWQDFPDLGLTIPSFILTKHEDNYYLTINVQVQENDEPNLLEHKLQKMMNDLLRTSYDFPNKPVINTTHEVKADDWKEKVQYASDYIKHHHAEKIVLARELRVTLQEETAISSILENLFETQPNSYIFAFEQGDSCFVGASPERLVKQEQNQILSTCLAGTAPRGETANEDTELADHLLHDSKNRREHDAVVKMIKESMENYCSHLNIPEKPVIYALKNLQHLYTPVTAKLKDGFTLFDIIHKLHPTPALGGVPREKSLTFIRNYEQLDRGWYGAPVGWIDSNQTGEFAVAIRSGLVQGDDVSLFAGCGVMNDSDPEIEYRETNMKFKPMLSVLGG